MAELLPRLKALARAGASATTSASTSMPRRPTGWRLSLDLLEALCARAGARRLERHRLRRPGLPQALPVRDRLAHRSRAAQRRRMMVRLVKGAYWDSEIKRAQVDGLEGFPVFTRKVHTDVSYIACARKLLAAPDAVLPAVRHPQRADAGDDPRRWPGRTSRRRLRVPVPARHGRAAVRGGGRARTSWTGRAASTRRSARTRRCSPIWCAGCWRTAPTPRSSTASPTATLPIDELVADPVDVVRAMPRAVGAPHRRIALPRDCSAPARANSAGLDLSNEAALRGAGRSAARRALRDRLERGAAARRSPSGAARRGRCSTRRPSRHRRHGRRGDDARRSPTPRCAAAPQPTGRRRRRHERAACLERAADLMQARMPALIGLIMREAGKIARQRHRRSARGDRLPALLRAHRRARRSATAHQPLGPGRLHQPVELPAGDLHRPGRRGAGRRQRRAGQARRGDAADRRRRPCACCTRPAFRRRAAAAARATARRRRGAGRRRAQSPA